MNFPEEPIGHSLLHSFCHESSDLFFILMQKKDFQFHSNPKMYFIGTFSIMQYFENEDVLNERCIDIALYCVLLYTQSALQPCAGSLLNWSMYWTEATQVYLIIHTSPFRKIMLKCEYEICHIWLEEFVFACVPSYFAPTIKTRALNIKLSI